MAPAVALFMANSPWAGAWHHFWETGIALRVGGWTTSHTLHHWINDGLMAVFFLVGLEIKREGLVGELASVRRASLPAAAALGGMVVPAALYAMLNGRGPGGAGWGVPMATDIAFALGVLALLGRRVPTSLKLFLAAIAIADDIGAVLVIALFYTDRIDWVALAAGQSWTSETLRERNQGRSGAVLPLPAGKVLGELWIHQHPAIRCERGGAELVPRE